MCKSLCPVSHEAYIDVTSQQQSREFVIATNLEAVNYGKDVGPDLTD